MARRVNHFDVERALLAAELDRQEEADIRMLKRALLAVAIAVIVVVWAW